MKAYALLVLTGAGISSLFGLPEPGARMNDPELRRLVSEYRSMTLGENLPGSIHGLRLSGHLYQDEQRFDLTTFRRAPGWVRTVIVVDRDQRYVQCYNGEVAWEQMGIAGNSRTRVMDEASTQRMKRYSGVVDHLLDASEEGTPVEYIGTETFRDTECHVLRVYLLDNLTVQYLLDVETLRKIATRSNELINGEERLWEIVYTDYERVEDLLLPMRILNRIDGAYHSHVVYRDADLNPTLFRTLFELPEDLAEKMGVETPDGDADS